MFGDDWTGGFLSVEEPPGIVCRKVSGGIEGVRVIGVDCVAPEVCSAPKTSLSDTLGPADAACHGDFGTLFVGAVAGRTGELAVAICSADCCCFC